MDKEALLSRLDWIDQMGIWAALVAAIGTVGLAYVAFAHWSAGKQLAPLEAAEKRAHEDAIAATRLEVAQANERAAEATRLAEQEKLARLKIEERLAPRVLTADGMTRGAKHLSSLGKQQIELMYLMGDAEVESLARSIAAMLGTAGWVVQSASATWASVPLAIMVQTGNGAPDGVRTAAAGLVEALRSERIDVFDVMVMPQQKATEITIIVGKK